MAKEKETRFVRPGNLSVENMTPVDIEKNVKDMFEACCGLIFKEEIDEIEFTLCVNVIQTTITYLKDKRETKGYL